MDFGVDRLIEMIEQRIGRPAANAVLWVVTIAVILWGLGTIGTFAAKVFSYGQGALAYFHGAPAPHLTPTDVLSLIYSLGLMFVLYVAFVTLVLVTRRRLLKSVGESLVEAQSIADDCKAFTDKNHEGLRAALERAEATMAAFREEVRTHREAHGLATESEKALNALEQSAPGNVMTDDPHN